MSKKATILLMVVVAAACLLVFRSVFATVALASPQDSPQDSSQTPPPLPAPPAEWVLSAAGAGTTQSVTRPAGGAGVQHVIDCVSGSVFSASTGGGALALLLEDHPSGGGTTFLSQWELPVPSSVNGHGSVNICGLNIVGSANGSDQLTFVGSGTNIIESVTMIGHDAT